VKRALLAMLGALALVLGGCAQQSSDPGAGSAELACACEPAAPIVDPTLLAFLSKARAAHHNADLAEQAGDREAAVRALTRVIEGSRPGGDPPLPEVAEVMADTRARLADLRSALGDFDRALADVDEGLKLATGVSHFRGHLLEVRGVVEERRSKVLREKGDEAGGVKARDAALKAFEEAIEIQEQVISQALKEREKGAPGRAEPR
jgi:tetratricopeptide (TPR) repeat protein